MSRWAVSFDIAKTYGKTVIAGATVAVRIRGTTVNIPGPIFADRQGGTTLSNPFTTAPGNIDFYLTAPQVVDILVTPTGQPPQTHMAVQVSTPTPTHQPLRSAGGLVLGWFSG